MRKLSAEDRSHVLGVRGLFVESLPGDPWLGLCFQYEDALAAAEERIRTLMVLLDKASWELVP